MSDEGNAFAVRLERPSSGILEIAKAKSWKTKGQLAQLEVLVDWSPAVPFPSMGARVSRWARKLANQLNRAIKVVGGWWLTANLRQYAAARECACHVTRELFAQS